MTAQIPLLAGWQVAFDVGAAPPRPCPWDIDLDFWDWDLSFVPGGDDFLFVPAGPQLSLVVRTRCAHCPACGGLVVLGDVEDGDEIAAAVRRCCMEKKGGST